MNPNLKPTPIDHPSHQPTPIPDSPSQSSSKSLSLPGSPHSNVHSRLIQTTPPDLNDLHHPLAPPPSDPHLFQQIINNRFVLGCALFASLGGILFGYDQGVISVTLVMDNFLSRFPDVDEHRPNGGSASFWKGFLTAMIELGAVVGVSLAGFIADQHGRKSAIRIGAVIFIVGSTIQTAAMNLSMLLLGRFVAGIGVGFLTMTCPMYMCEISPSNIRGALLCLEEFNIVLGIVIAVWTTYATRLIDSEFSWRFPFGIQLIPAFIILLGLNLLPPSPSWLASHKKHQECLQALSVLRQLPAEDQSVKREWIDIRVEAGFQHEHDLVRFGELPNGFWSQLTVEFRKWQDTFSKSYRKRTLVGVGLTFFQQFVGINVCPIYDRTSFL